MNRRVSKIEESKRSACRSTVGCARRCAEPHVEHRKGVIYTKHGRRTWIRLSRHLPGWTHRNRVKTARRDALTLAGLARARLKARQQLKALLLRHGRRYTGKTSWNPAHERYLAAVSFDHRAQNVAFGEYRQAVSEAQARVQRLREALTQELENWRMRPLVLGLMTLRGWINWSPPPWLAELGELNRFAHPRELMGYLGLVPSEYTSGEKRRPGRITKTGNTHARRVLIEMAWNYRFPPRITVPLQTRQEQQLPAVRAISWRAQLRLNHRYRQLSACGVQYNKVLRGDRARSGGLCVEHRPTDQPAHLRATTRSARGNPHDVIGIHTGSASVVATRIDKSMRHVVTAPGISERPKASGRACRPRAARLRDLNARSNDWSTVEEKYAIHVSPQLQFAAGVHVNYHESVLRIQDGLSKFNDLPKDMGGTGVTLPE